MKDVHGVVVHETDRKNDYLYRISLKGIVLDEKGHVLAVKESSADQSWWDLPGGGMDHGEDIKTALAREMKEEVNLVGDFTYRILTIDREPVLLEDANVYQIRLFMHIEPENMEFSVGDDAHAISFIPPEEFLTGTSSRHIEAINDIIRICKQLHGKTIDIYTLKCYN